MAAVYLSQASISRRGIDIVPLIDIDELSEASRAIWAIYLRQVIAAIRNPTSAINMALDVIMQDVRRDNELGEAISTGTTNRLRSQTDNQSAPIGEEEEEELNIL